MTTPCFVRVKIVFLLVLAGTLAHPAHAASTPTRPVLLPVPLEASFTDSRLSLPDGLSVDWVEPASPRMKRAVERLFQRLRLEIGHDVANSPQPGRPSLRLECGTPDTGLYPSLGDDESYELHVTAEGAALRAPQWRGMLHGLETLPQLLDEQGGLSLGVIRDTPRFPWRGLMIDVSRHWMPKAVLLRNLAGMAQVKLNILHLHLSDDQGFRFESRTHPELQREGSDGRFFTQEELRDIIEYASDRGIRVVPEFDVPGHATSWLVSHPELGSAPGPYHVQRKWGVFDPVFDPTHEGTYQLLAEVLGEVAALFPDAYVHIGGDENNGVHWSANPRIQDFIKQHGFHGNEGLHTHFNGRLHGVLKSLGKRMLGWDEILQPGLPQDAVIHSWRGTEALAQAARRGYSGLLSNGYYIDLCEPASRHYLVDPLPEGNELTEKERARILGGEATQWAEWVDEETIDSRIWPRTAAIAERLWSPQQVRDVDDMYRRLEYTSLRLERAGLEHRLHGERALLKLLDAPEREDSLAALRAVVSLVEPVKGNRRGERQPWHNQWLPLDGIADAAVPDSARSRALARELRACSETAAPDAAALKVLRQSLEAWRSVGLEVGWGIGPRHRRLVDAAEIAKELVAACDVGLAIVTHLENKTLPSTDTAAAWVKTLETCARSNASAVELPFIQELRNLAARWNSPRP